MPFAAIPGNHDRRALMHEAFPDPAYGETDAALNSTRRVGGLDPPFNCGIVSSDGMRLLNADALAALLKRHPRALLVAAGHVHRAAQTVFAGISATICPAGEQAVTLEFELRRPEVFRIELPAFHLHAWLPAAVSGSVVTHVVSTGV